MKIKWDNFAKGSGDAPINPFMYVFTYITAVFGICFTFFPHVSGAYQTFLYELTTLQTQEFTTSIWGLCAIVAVVIGLVALNYRKRWMGNAASMFGFLVWLFAAVTYAVGGFWFGFLVAALPNVYFWAWMYFKTEQYHRRYG